ncbi:ScyD/ScyE family protein [Geodermatophilus sp. SYSU D00079]
MRKTIIAAGSFALLLGSATAASALPPGSDPPDHVVVAGGLDNPRQLAWSGRTLLVAESGQGGEDCAPPAPEAPPAAAPVVEDPAVDAPVTDAPVTDAPAIDAPATPGDDDGTADQGPGDTPVAPDPTTDDTTTDGTPADGTATDDTAGAAAVEVCEGPTGDISAIERPGRTEDGEAEAVVDGLYSVESPEGAVGPAGVAATDRDDVLLIAQGELSPDALAGDTDDALAATQEHLLVSDDGVVRPWVDLGQAEADQDPDGNGVADSNPNAVLFVDGEDDGDDSGDDSGEDSGDDNSGDGGQYALVADAGANAVWKVTADFDDLRDDELPDYEVSVFAAFPVEEGEPEFVPSALARDAEGNVYVGGVGGGLAPGGAEVVRLDADGEETGRWSGFTAINGIAVAPDGEHVYVSQVFGSEGPAGGGTGSVVRFETEDSDEATYAEVDIPFPSGLLLGRDDTVYVAAYSLSPADADDPATEDTEGGQVWRFAFPEDAEELPLPVVTAPAPAAPAEPAPTTPDDGTATGDGTGVPGDDTAVPGDDDGTPDQGSGDVPGTATGDDTVVPGDDDGTADQGSGDAPGTATGDDGTVDQGSGDDAPAPPRRGPRA